MSVTPEQRLERLKNLERVMLDVEMRHKRELAAGRKSPFNMDLWACSARDYVGAPSCGTYACAVGWACLDPWFNEQGLSLDRPLDVGSSYPLTKEGYQPYKDYDNVAYFFGIDYGESRHVFSPDKYHTCDPDDCNELAIEPSQVLGRIRELIKKYAV